MSYDDIRFSHWDDPDDDDFDDDDFDDEGPYIWGFDADKYEHDDLPDDGAECVMCGKERILNAEGYCSQCWQVWTS